MKLSNIISTILCAAALLCGCSKNVSENEVVRSFSIVTEAAPTKATADNDGHAALIDRCQVQIWMKTGDNYSLYLVPEVASSDNTHYSFSATFVKNQQYKIVVWADTEGYYTLGQDAVVTRADRTIDNKDALDAFFACEDVDASATIGGTIIAKRPFAQLNIITTDLQKIPAQFVPKKVSVSYEAPVSMNLLTGELGAPSTISVEKADVYYSTVAAASTLSMDYIFAEPEREVCGDIKYTIHYAEDITRTFSGVGIQRNYRTNIKGDLLSLEADFEVIVDADWNTPEIDN